MYRPTTSWTFAMEPNLTRDTTPALVFTLPETDPLFRIRDGRLPGSMTGHPRCS
jgi:hypothetical protein